MNKKLPQTLSDDELIAQLVRDGETEEIVSNNDILLFISTYNIQSGDKSIAQKLLYRLYKSWSRNPLKSKTFTNEMLLYFTRVGNNLKINQDAIKLSKMAQDAFLKESRPRTKSPTHRAHFEAFMKHYGLSRGTFWASTEILFDLYDEWCYSNKRSTQLAIKTFRSFLKLYFKSRRIKNRSTVFSVDKSITKHISNERIENIRNSRKNRRAQKAKEARKATQSTKED
jgi:hypothetical protein